MNAVLHSIRFRLFLTVGLVVVVALVVVAAFTSRVTRTEFNRFLSLTLPLEEGTPDPALKQRLEGFYERHGSWEGVDSILKLLPQGEQRARGVVLVDARGEITETSAPDLLKGKIRTGPDSMIIVNMTVRRGDGETREEVRFRGHQRELTDQKGQQVGAFFSMPVEPPHRRTFRREFLVSVNRWLLGVVLGVGALALVSTALLARRILRPVEELTSIAREMGRGDLSRRATVKSKDEISELARTFNGMADGLSRIERLRRNMVEDIAHELRTPLTNVRCQLEALQDGLVQPDRDVIDSLHEEVLALSRLVGTMQDLALAEAGQLPLNLERLGVHEEIEKVARSFRGANPEGGALRLELDLPDALPEAQADGERFRQILRNLLTNAVRHGGPEGRVTVGARPREGMIEISVSDQGPGIAEEDLPFVFERFYRADRSRQRETGGAGLGLAIAKQLVEAQGGRIWVNTKPGEGAEFVFTLPIA